MSRKKNNEKLLETKTRSGKLVWKFFDCLGSRTKRWGYLYLWMETAFAGKWKVRSSAKCVTGVQFENEISTYFLFSFSLALP